MLFPPYMKIYQIIEMIRKKINGKYSDFITLYVNIC